MLFESAADAYGEDTIGIILSGANNDGAQGLQAVAFQVGSFWSRAPGNRLCPGDASAALEGCPCPEFECGRNCGIFAERNAAMSSLQAEAVYFLLVDDLEENLLSLEALLRRDGLVMLKARSGPEALEMLLKYEVALALLDVQMPGMDGFELAELMRGTERTRRVPIIFLTAEVRTGSGGSADMKPARSTFSISRLSPTSCAARLACFSSCIGSASNWPVSVTSSKFTPRP